MVNASISNTVVSEQVSAGGTFTIPAGEVWKATVNATDTSLSRTNHSVAVERGPGEVLYKYQVNTGSDGTGISSGGREVVLEGGDEIHCEQKGSTDPAGAIIQGIRVDNTVSNTPVNERIETGNSINVPAGENWRVTVVTGESLSGGGSDSNNHVVWLEVNGVPAYNYRHSSAGNSETRPAVMYLTGGDTLSVGSSGTGSSDVNASISGFVVNE